MERIKLIIDSVNELSFEEKETVRAENKHFLKSIGLKSDCVGWTEIDLCLPEAKMYLEKIDYYVKSCGKRVRIGYEWRREYELSKWYLIEPKFLDYDIRVFNKDNSIGEDVCVGICSYKITTNHPIIMWDFMKATAAIVSKTFAESIKRNKLTGAECVWAYDGGKY